MRSQIVFVLVSLEGKKANKSHFPQFTSLDAAKAAAEEEPANRHIVIHEVKVDADEIIVKDCGVRAEIDSVGPRQSGPPF